MIFHRLYLTTIVILLFAPTLSALPLIWGSYRWIQSQKSLFQPITQKQITLSHPASIYTFVKLTTQDNIKQQFNSYNLSVYHVKGKSNGQIKILGKQKWMEISVQNVSDFQIQVGCLKELQECQFNSKQIIYQLKNNEFVSISCKNQSQNKFVCSSSQNNVVIHITLAKSQKPNPTSISQLHQFHLQSTKSFMAKYNITISPQKLQIVQDSLSSLISSICFYRQQQQFYLGYCQLNRNKKWTYNIKLAAFAIYLLADYHYQLAREIYKDYFTLVQNKLLYPLDTVSDILPFPEHIEVFMKFGTTLQLQNQAQLLNSLFVIPMLKQLGTLHDQLNYRQAKQLHPLLLKMLQLKWSANSLKSSIKSIYQQSFTQDYKYHVYGQQLQVSTTKCAYIYKIIDTFTSILIKHHAFYMPVEHIKQHLQEHFTLLNIIRAYANDDPYAKQGKYKDVVNIGKDMKVYSKFNGYQSILPYVYGLGKVYPQIVIKQLQTSFGLKSSSQQQREQYQRKYRYRGDIHSYFNIKIITGLLYRLQQDKMIPTNRKDQISLHLTKIATSIGNKVLKDYKLNKQIYTSWSTEGRGKERQQWGKIFTALFLKWV